MNIDIPLTEGQSKRTDCPNCGGKYTFSISLHNGELLYHCFRASCGFKGRKQQQITIDSIRNKIDVDISLKKEYNIPEYWGSPLSNYKSLSFIRYWKLLDSYKEGLELYYDPKQDRIVFPLRDYNKNLKGATGRSLSGQLPKWYIYERIDDCPYISLKGDINACIIVEDCISAVRCPVNSISLLGTNIPITVASSHFKTFDLVLICLDDDATLKSIKLQHELSVFCNAKILPLRNDIKYFNEKELEELCNYIKGV